MKKYTIRAVDPPKLQNHYGVWFGFLTAMVAVFFAILHLFRVDTLAPIVNTYLPGDIVAANLVTVSIITVEIFSVPFALRMKLSPLAHVVSGLFVVIAPLSWLLLTIWCFGLDVSTGQFGQFAYITSSWVPIVMNSLWLVFCFVTLWVLGYSKYKLPERRKNS